MDWIHCNLCFIQPKDTNPNFILTSCGHIFCETCANSGTSNECKICQANCSMKHLSSDMDSNVKLYFEERVEIIEKAIKAFKFQRSHRLNLIGRHAQYMNKYQAAKAHIQKMEARIQKMEGRIQKLRMYEKKLEKNQHEKQGISPPTNKFNFSPYTESPFSSYNNIRTPVSCLKSTSNTFQNHRHLTPLTPNTPVSESSARSTPNSNYGFSGQSRYDSSIKTPQGALKVLKITERRNK